MAMTWRELREKIDAMTFEQVISAVTIHLHSRDEYYAVDHFELVNDNEEDRLDDGHPFLVVLDTGREANSQFLLRCEPNERGEHQLVKVARSESKNLLEISLPGYGTKTMDDDFGGIIALENYNGLRLHVWSDINQEDPTHVINLENAKLEKRLPDLKIDDNVWVREQETNSFIPAHFAGWSVDGRSMLVWPLGRTSHTRKGTSPLLFEQWRLTPEAAT
jgi:hypothetical protein